MSASTSRIPNTPIVAEHTQQSHGNTATPLDRPRGSSSFVLEPQRSFLGLCDILTGSTLLSMRCVTGERLSLPSPLTSSTISISSKISYDVLSATVSVRPSKHWNGIGPRASQTEAAVPLPECCRSPQTQVLPAPIASPPPHNTSRQAHRKSNPSRTLCRLPP